MATQTKLSQKLRALADNPKYEDKRTRLLYAAAELDRGLLSLGQNFGKGGMIYYQGRKLYCEITGRQWDWAAEHDLDPVPYAPQQN